MTELYKKYQVKGRKLKAAKAMAKDYPGEVCFFCGTLIGKDYGSYSHSCKNKESYRTELQKQQNEAIDKFVKWLNAAEDVQVNVIDREGNQVKTISVPILKKRATYMGSMYDNFFVIPAIIQIDDTLYKAKKTYYQNDDREIKEIVPEWKV